MLLWSLSFLTPYSIIGYIEILIIAAFLKFVLIIVYSQNFLDFKSSINIIEPAFDKII